MKKEMLINVLQPEEARIAIIEDGVLQELYVERASQESYVNNIYKGRIVNVEPSIQAAFVDFGIGRNGFLHVSDVDAVYYEHLGSEYADVDLEEGPPPRRDDRGPRRDDRGPRRDDRGPRRDDRGGRDRNEDRPPPPRDFTPVAVQASPEEAAAENIPVAETYHDEELAGFGEGIELDSNGDEVVRQDDGPEDVELVVTEEATAEESEEAKPKGRRRGGKKPAAKKEEAVEKPAAKKRGKKKDDTMPAAEHRTGKGDDGFGGGIFFDPDAPNDRFGEGVPVAPTQAFHEAEEASEAVLESESEDGDEPFGAFTGEVGEAPPPQQDRGERNYDRGPRRDDRGPRRDDRGPRRDDRGPRRDDRGPRPGGGQSRSFSRDGGKPKPPIEKIFKRGQEVIVQVIKEGIGTKGPTLSTYISIAGRYLVLMPSLNRLAVSRKIEEPGVRGRLKEALGQLEPPKGIGFIIRTAAIDKNVQELQNDLNYLVRLWEVFTTRVKKKQGPSEIYRESDMVIRTIRDNFTADIEKIWIDGPDAYAAASDFLKIVMPRYADRLKLYEDIEPLFHKYKVEEEIAKIQEKKLPLPMGGSIVMEQTEALVAIDVNSGSFRSEGNAEDTAYQMNLQAAKEIARQLRLRDMGGVIVNDFIDMKEEKHRRSVERALSDALARDRARTKILKTSAFGVIEMTRQRIRPSLKRSTHVECGHCRGSGHVKTAESMSIELIRLFQLAAFRKNIQQIVAHVHADVAHFLLNKKRKDILKWEEAAGMQITVHGRIGVSPEFVELHCFDGNGTEVRFANAPQPAIAAAPERREPREEQQRDDRGPRRDDRGGGDRGGRGGDRGGRGGDRGGRGGDRRGGGGGRR